MLLLPEYPTDLHTPLSFCSIDTPGVISRVSQLFNGNPFLIQGFNTFLPQGYRIDISQDPRDNMITVTTPEGTTRQSTFGQREIVLPPPPISTPGFPLSLPFHRHALTTYAGGILTRSLTPIAYQHAHAPAPLDGIFSPNFPGASQSRKAAALLGNLNNSHSVDPQSSGEFNHAIQYLNKIKARYSDDPNTYKQFLEILQTHHREQRHVQDVSFPCRAHILSSRSHSHRFMHKSRCCSKMPRICYTSSGAFSLPLSVLLSHLLGPLASCLCRLVHLLARRGPLTCLLVASISLRRASRSRGERSGRQIKNRHLYQLPGAPKAEYGWNRFFFGDVLTLSTQAKKLKHAHKGDPSTPPFSPYQAPISPQNVQTHSQGHTTVHQTSHSHAPQTGHFSASGMTSAPDEYVFFDRARKQMEARETYDDFLKLLNMYQKDIIDIKTLIERAQIFLGDGDLLMLLKEITGWDDKLESVDHGPPGSVRTGPPEPLAAAPPADGEGPSYRKLPESVSESAMKMTVRTAPDSRV
jgi:paired amphipathic helix protein Sin3a